MLHHSPASRSCRSNRSIRSNRSGRSSASPAPPASLAAGGALGAVSRVRPAALPLLLGALLLATLLLASCERTPVEPTLPADPVAGKATTLLSARASGDLDPLADLWNRSEHDDWVAVTGTIDALQDSWVSGVPEGYPADFEFGFFIPAGTVVEDPLVTPDYPSVTLTILAPRYYAPPKIQPDYAPVCRLEPHGLQFDTSVAEPTVTLCYPPWLDPFEIYDTFCLHQDDTETEASYYLTDLTEAIVPEDGGAEAASHTGITFKIPHFSKWALENGGGD